MKAEDVLLISDLSPGRWQISRGISARCEQGVPRDCGLVAIW
jgi:hypothetical protein